MLKFTVLQSTTPTFGFVSVASVTGWERYRAVASGQAPASMSDLAICELAFEKTNSVSRAWFDIAGASGLMDVVKSRSTSVGDVVKIADAEGANERYYRCEDVGWKRVDAVALAA